MLKWLFMVKTSQCLQSNELILFKVRWSRVDCQEADLKENKKKKKKKPKTKQQTGT